MTPGLGSPRKALDRSWLVDGERTARLDDDVRLRLRAARSVRELEAKEPAFSVQILVEQVKRAVRWDRPFIATTACAMLGELLYASEHLRDHRRVGVASPIYKVPPSKRLADAERDDIHRPLVALRNACMHPAYVIGAGVEAPPVLRFAKALEAAANDSLATFIERDWSRLHDAVVTCWAIGAIDRAGRYDLGELGRRLDRR